jgi:phosphoglycolate phosphatase
MQRQFQAVLFDLDGTLVDSLADLANATNHALASLGCPTHSRAAYRHFVGDGARTLCQRALPADEPELLEPALALMRAHYDAHRYDETRPYPGVPELIAALAERGYRLAVLSNKPDQFTQELVAHYFPAVPFAAIRGQLPGVPLKPDPAAALRMAQELGIPPDRWLYLGDTNTDMRTARAAGMHAVGVLWGFRDRAELEASGAHRLLAQPGDLLAWLENEQGRTRVRP